MADYEDKEFEDFDELPPESLDTQNDQDDDDEEPTAKPSASRKTAQDWARDKRMSADVNGTTVGVATDRVTPELLLATSKKLLSVSRREAQPDQKDSLQFQRVYGPAEYFAEHVLRDGGKLGRNLLWKATNRGNLDFMQPGALDKHVSDVFYDSKLANMVDGSSPLELMDGAVKVTRLGEGGVGDTDSAPVEMRLVQPSFAGFVDPVRCYSPDTEILTESGWVRVDQLNMDHRLAVLLDGVTKFAPMEKDVFVQSYPGTLYVYDDGVISFIVTPGHRMHVRIGDEADYRIVHMSELSEILEKEPVFVRTGLEDASEHRLSPDRFQLAEWAGDVFCPTVPGGLVYCRRNQGQGFWCGNSVDSFRIGLDAYFAKGLIKGSDGKLYRKMLNARTGKEELVDSVTAAKSVVTTPDMMESNTSSVYALGGDTGARIVDRKDVDYVLPRPDEMFSTASNVVPMLSGVKEMRLHMGCLHPSTPVVVYRKGWVDVIRACDMGNSCETIGVDDDVEKMLPVRNTVSRFPTSRNCFRAVRLLSGRSLVTSDSHRWKVQRNGKWMLVTADKLKEGDVVLRSLYSSVPTRRPFVLGKYVTADFAYALGLACRSLTLTEKGKGMPRLECPADRIDAVVSALEAIGECQVAKYNHNGVWLVRVEAGELADWLVKNVGTTKETRKVPSCILSAGMMQAAAFIQGFTTSPDKSALDQEEDAWILGIDNSILRDGVAIVLSRLYTDTLYRDSREHGLCLQLQPLEADYSNMAVDVVKSVTKEKAAAYMVDVDVDDRLFATANGIVTHNSKYALQAVPLDKPAPQLVRSLDEESGKDMPSLIGKYLGALYAKKGGKVTAVRKDRIDVVYDDGSKASVPLYVNFPMNQKGYISSRPVVKAGQAFGKGDILAASNWTDDKGTAAIGAPLRTAWLSWKGGTYEDGIAISQSCAEKLRSTTMYSTSMDLDKTVRLGRNSFTSWKPDAFSKEQLENIGDDGIVKPGTVLKPGDPMILAVQTTEPGPGTLGKRILTDVSEKWEHDRPGVVTDVVRTRTGVKVLTTVSSPVEVGDKLSGCFDDKTEIFTDRGFKLFKDLEKADKIAVLQEDGTAKFELPLAYQSDHYKGCMVECHSAKGVSMSVTPNHNVAFFREVTDIYEDSGLIKEDAANVYGKSIYMRSAAKFESTQECGYDTINLSVEELRVLLQGALMSSVAAPSDGSIQCLVYSKSLADKLQRLVILAGYCCDIKEYFYQGGDRACFSVDVYPLPYKSVGKEDWKIRDDYDGMIYCVTSSTGVVLTRRDGMVTWNGQSYGNKGVVSQIIPDDEMPQDKDGNPIDLLFSPLGLITRCYDADTEFRTKDGWKKGADVKPEDLLYTYDTRLRVWAWDKQVAPMHVSDYDGSMYRYADDNVDFLVTPHHRVWARIFSGGYSAYLVEDIFGMDCHIPYLGNSEAHLHASGWSKETYKGKIYCPSVETGYVQIRRNGKICVLGNTNASQLHEALLGKVAHKTGKPEIIPEFYKGDLMDYVNGRLKQARLSPEDDLVDPSTGKVLKGITNGYSYIYRLKHMAESKLSARGTDKYTADETPASGSYEGCFPARQEITTAHGNMSIATICEKRLPLAVLTWGEESGWCYRSITDWFIRRARISDILHIRTEYNLASNGEGKWVRHHTSMYPTKNHVLYRADMTKVFAGDVKVGDLLASFGYEPTEDQKKVILGTLLGDSYIDLGGNLQCVHSKVQDQWITWKYRALSGLGATLPSTLYKTTESMASNTKIRSTWARILRVPRSAFLADVESKVESAGTPRRRVVTKDILDSLGELGVSVWFIDDGSIADHRKSINATHQPEACLATNCFSAEEVKLIAEWFASFLELDEIPHLSRHDHKDGTEAYYIRFNRAASWKILEIISRHIPFDAIPDSKKLLRKYCREVQEKEGVVEHSFISKPSVVPARVVSISEYKHDKPGVTEIPVYDFTVDETHKYTLAGGNLVSNSKRYGNLEVSAMVGHGAFNSLQDAQQIRGQSNADFWREVRTGGIPTMPGEPFVHKKFFDTLKASGVNVRRTQKGVSVFALTDSDVKEMAGPREVRTKDTFDAKNYTPMDGGLFGKDVFGPNGDKWGYIQLDEPLPNPVMEDPITRLLRMKKGDFEAVVAGEREVDGMKSTADIKKRLSTINLEQEAEKAKKEFKSSTRSKKDDALKRYRAVEMMRRNGVNPAEYMLDRIPVLPPAYRPVSTHSGLTMVADSNYLYAQLMDARDDLRAAKDLPDEYAKEARASVYRKWKELVGLYEPENPKLKSKSIKGLLGWALGTGSSPKASAVQRKVIGTSVDTVGRGVVVPDPRIKLNEIGMPEKMAFDVMAPFVQRELVRSGYTPIDAMKMVKARDPRARRELLRVMETHPLQMNRAPTLHKLSIIGARPVLVSGHAIHVNPSIVVPLAMDFDGDTIQGEWLIAFEANELAENLTKYKISDKKFLTSSLFGVSYDNAGKVWRRSEETQKEEEEMFGKKEAGRFSTAVCSPSELPVIPESEKVEGRVTEWDVVPGVYTYTLGLDGACVLAPVTKVSRHTGLKMFDCTLSACGLYPHVVTASSDHSLITFNPETMALEKTRPEDSVGRLVPRVRRSCNNTVDTVVQRIQLDAVYALDRDFGILLGMILGDGWITKQGQCLIAACDPSVQREILRLTDKETTKLPVLSETLVHSYTAGEGRFSSNDAQRIDLHTRYSFGQALRERIGHGAENKRIPSECLAASYAHMSGILMGLLATDGSVTYAEGTSAKKSKAKTVTIHTTSPELRDGIRELCTRLGIRTSVTPYKGKNSVFECYAVCLSIVDLAREARRRPASYVIPHDRKNETLQRIIKDVEECGTLRRSPEIVPMPSCLTAEFTYAKVGSGSLLSEARSRGYLNRRIAYEMAEKLKKVDWDKFTEFSGLAKTARRGHTPEMAKEFISSWISIVEDEELGWEKVDEVTPSACTEGWDCTVPGPYTFTLFDGTVVQDTVNLHVPVSDAAREDTRNRMFPERNLVAMRDRKIAYKPEKEYQQGLYVATRMKEGERPRIFDTLEEARAALRRGDIDVDDPIIINRK